MKRLSSSPDSLEALMSICPKSTAVEVDDEQQQPGLYSMEGEEGCCVVEEVCNKKRRLSVEQVKALEKNFEVENKLEPERKVKLAQELGLQPRQVAVWFQNRRARWKTKQLKRDYGILKANHDALKLTFEALQRDNDSLLKQIEELKSKVRDEEEISDPVNEEEEEEEEEDDDFGNGSPQMLLGSFLEDFKDGSSDSDSSAILNEEIAINKNKKSEDEQQQKQMVEIHSGCSSSFQVVKIEEHNFFDEESCSTLFSDDQPPTLSWCCSHDWN